MDDAPAGKKPKWQPPPEQVALREFFDQTTAETACPYFVKVGAHDGLTGDPCRDYFLTHASWHGLLVEPVARLADKLQANYSDGRFRFERVAVGAEAGQRTFYSVSPRAGEVLEDLPVWFDQLGAFDRGHITKHLHGRLEPFIEETTVRVETLSALIENHSIDSLSFLHVDTEGHDLVVLESLDLQRHRPDAIFIEHRHLSPQDRDAMNQLLTANGYRVEDFGADFFAS